MNSVLASLQPYGNCREIKKNSKTGCTGQGWEVYLIITVKRRGKKKLFIYKTAAHLSDQGVCLNFSKKSNNDPIAL